MPAPGWVPPPTRYSPRRRRVAVGRAQPGGLLQRRLDGERVAPRRAEVALEVVGRHAVLDDGRRVQALEAERRLEILDERVAQAVGLDVPVDAPLALVGHRQQHAQRVAARRRHPRLAARGRVHVGRERRRDPPAARDVADEAPVAAADEQRVVEQRLEGAVGPEIQQKAGHRRRQAPQRRAPAGRARACAARRRWRRRRRPRCARRSRARRPSPSPGGARCARPARRSVRPGRGPSPRRSRRPPRGRTRPRRGTAGRRALHRWLVRETGLRR